jgi:hypothetical protein
MQRQAVHAQSKLCLRPVPIQSRNSLRCCTVSARMLRTSPQLRAIHESQSGEQQSEIASWLNMYLAAYNSACFLGWCARGS